MYRFKSQSGLTFFVLLNVLSFLEIGIKQMIDKLGIVQFELPRNFLVNGLPIQSAGVFLSGLRRQREDFLTQCQGVGFGWRFELAAVPKQFRQTPLQDEFRARSQQFLEFRLQLLPGPADVSLKGFDQGLGQAEQVRIVRRNIVRVDIVVSHASPEEITGKHCAGFSSCW